MSGSVTDSDACGTDWENWIPQIDSTNENNFTWKPQWKNFRIKICSQDKVLENPSGYLDPIKIQFLMTHHFSKVQKIIRNLDISTIESINSTEELLEIKLKSVEDEDILTEIESALARKIGEIVMIPIQRLKFTSSLIEELFRQELKEKSIALMRDETNIFIVGFEKMKSYIFKNIDEIHRVTAKKVVKLEDKWKTEAVKYFGIAETIGRTFTDVVVRLQEDNSSVYLKGRDITISKAEKEVHKLLSELFTETLHFDPLILKLLMCKEASELLKQNLVKEQLKVVWTVDSTHLYFISKTKINTDALKAVVYKNFLAAGFSKSPHQESQFCDSEVFTKITKQHNDKLLFLETTGTSVNIAGTKSLIFRILHQEKLFYNDDIDTVDEIDQSIKMIKVSNISTGTSEDCIRYFFENKRKSGGGDIEDLDYDKDSHTAIITFEEDEVAGRVISRMPLLFEKKNIDVEIFVPRPLTADVEDDEQALGNEETADMPTEFVIEVRGMKPTTSGDTIRYYFESRKVANADVIKMEFIEEKGMYLIWFEEESAIEAVISKNLRVEGQTLNAKRYVPLPPPKPVPKYDENVGLEANKGELLRPIPQTKICRTIAMCTIASGQTIKTVVGDITELDVDVIVNQANKELKHVGGLSKVIVDKGGKIIQKECDDYIRSKNRARKMYEGEVFCSTPGNLNCKMIAHAVGPVWQNGQSSEDEYLSECIEASLEKTEEMKYRSIAIPALCTGVFGYPANKATTVIVEAIYDYMRENGTTTPIKQIYLCDVKEDTVSHFVSALDKFFGK